MDKEKMPEAKEPYLGSVRFYKNMILLAVILLIAIPTVLAVRFWLIAEGRGREASEYAQEYARARAALEEYEELPALQEPWQELDAEPIPYQRLYPDFYVTEEMPEITAVPNTMYLTFDDGPSDHTEDILSILREKDVKATFFVVTKGGETAVSRMKRIVAEGHALGMHSYTHDFHTIYDSVEAFLEDYYQLFTLIRDEVGVVPTVFRFPGGSLNGYDRGVYQEIIAEMLRRGFVYYDWNLSAEDALSVPPPKEQILRNILDRSGRVTRGIVLMHDSNHCTTTVEALPELIDDLREQGFAFDSIDRSVKPVIFNYKSP